MMMTALFQEDEEKEKTLKAMDDLGKQIIRKRARSEDG